MRADKIKTKRRARRKRGIRKRISGTPEQPRLTVFRSSKHIYAQLIDDLSGVTLCDASTRSKGVRDGLKDGGQDGGKISAAKRVGAVLAERAKEKNIRTVCFDRNGYRFHGRIKGLADAAREGGLEF